MPVKKALSLAVVLLSLVGLAVLLVSGGHAQDAKTQARGKKVGDFDNQITANMEGMMEAGRDTFRKDTFGDEAFWGDSLQLHKAIAGAGLGGMLELVEYLKSL